MHNPKRTPSARKRRQTAQWPSIWTCGSPRTCDVEQFNIHFRTP